MLIDALHVLEGANFPIRQYQYTGCGSIYFVDFILFHRLLGIRRMLSAEASTKIRRRVMFNRPFRCIEIKMRPIGEVIPALSQDLSHLLWLDYDNVLCRDFLDDIHSAGTYLTRGSILLVTVDVEPPSIGVPAGGAAGPREWKKYFEEEAGDLVGRASPVTAFGRSQLPYRNREIIERAIRAGLAGRNEVSFQPLFSFLYADGHQMITVGGMIVAEKEALQLKGSGLLDIPHTRADWTKPFYEIRVPKLTRKERLYLDGIMPASRGVPKEFDLERDDLSAYREVYRFLPAYAELLL
jgi:hypothetical protein